MIDFHCHLELYRDPQKLIENCASQGLEVLSVGTTPSAYMGTRRLAEGHSSIRTALGFHPHLAGQRMSELQLFDELISQVTYVGEVGLDGAPEFRKSWDQQYRVFNHILEQCSNFGGRILSIHSRRAAGEVLIALEKNEGCGTPIFHWFSGTQRELSQAISIGAWFSVGPAMLRGKRGCELAAAMPPDRILTETDGPFATARGLQLRPGEVGAACDALGEIWGCRSDEARTRVRSNLAMLDAVKRQLKT